MKQTMVMFRLQVVCFTIGSTLVSQDMFDFVLKVICVSYTCKFSDTFIAKKTTSIVQILLSMINSKQRK